MADAKLMSDWEEMEGLANQAIDESAFGDEKEEEDPLAQPTKASIMNSSEVVLEVIMNYYAYRMCFDVYIAYF